jgi:putative flippase GtrA
MSNYWTFRAGGGDKLKKLLKYSSLAFFNYLADIGLFGLFVTNYDMNHVLAKVIITAMIVCWNFLLYKLWVFK